MKKEGLIKFTIQTTATGTRYWWLATRGTRMLAESTETYGRRYDCELALHRFIMTVMNGNWKSEVKR